MADKEVASYEKLLNFVKQVIEQDEQLREKYKMGDKFRFIRDHLSGLLKKIEVNFQEKQAKAAKEEKKLGEEDVLVYVHLFNVQGAMLQTWSKFLNSALFYEYSVNRPIYKALTDIEAFMKTKTNKSQHGYLAIAVHRDDIIQSNKEEIGLPIRVREGSLKIENLQNFTHNGNHYRLENDGILRIITDLD